MNSLTHGLVNLLVFLILEQFVTIPPLGLIMVVLGGIVPDLDRGGGIVLHEGRLLPKPFVNTRLTNPIKFIDRVVLINVHDLLIRPLAGCPGYLHSLIIAGVFTLGAGGIALFTTATAPLWFSVGWLLHIAVAGLMGENARYLLPYETRRYTPQWSLPYNAGVEGAVWVGGLSLIISLVVL